MGLPAAQTQCSERSSARKSQAAFTTTCFSSFSDYTSIARSKRAELLAAKLVETKDLKHFLADICSETYTDIEKHRANVEYLEAHFPAYSESSECQGEPIWGDFKLGRLPQFLYADAESLRNHSSHTVPLQKSSDAQPSQFKMMFDAAFQFFQERCQHHIHKLVDGKRVVPNACRSKTKPKECKHEAPWTIV